MKKGTLAIPLVVLAFASLGLGTASAQWSRSDLLAQGYKLPKQWGIGIVYYYQTQPYKIESLTLGIPGFDPAIAKGLKVDNKVKSYHAVFDYWALPFLNLELLAGKIDGKTKVGLSGINIGIPLENIDVDYDGLFYGGGFTLAAGGKRFFGTLTTEYTNTNLKQEDSSVSAWIVTPRLGMNVGESSSVYVGGMYERPDEKHKGTYTVPMLGPVPYQVTLGSKYAWSYIAGANIGLTEHWMLVVEGGFGNRDGAMAHLSYRW
jgi:hypothetical protein